MEKVLASGKTLTMSTPSWASACALKTAVFKEIGDQIPALFGKKGVTEKEAMLACLSVALSSEKIEAAMWQVLKTARYGVDLIEPKLFDDDETAREDYFEIMKEAATFTLTPFFKNLDSLF